MHFLHALNGPWLACLFFSLGLLPGTWLMRALQLPRAFWLPMVYATASLIAYGELWVFFFSPLAATTVSSVVLFGCVAGFIALLLWTDTAVWLAHRDVWLPVVLTALLTCAYAGALSWAGVTSTYRFAVPLPPEDNLFPLYFADRLYYGYHTGHGPPAPLTTLMLTIKTSDRPPLQAAVLLAVRSLGLNGPHGSLDQQTYQTVAMTCQMVWVAGLYALGRTIALSRRQLAFALGGAACSGFFFLHSLYTWPKLFAAWLFLLALALMIHVLRSSPARPWRFWLAIGGSTALALLAHGGPFFSLVALPLLLLRREVRTGLRPARLACAVLVGLTVLAPWMAYQRYYDPPGNMLVKLHLAGVVAPDDRSTWEAIVTAYRGVTFSEYVAGRWDNLREQFLVPMPFPAPNRLFWVQWQQVYHHLPALDFLTVGLGVFLFTRLRAGPSRPLSLTSLTWYAIGATGIWMVMIFTPRGALIHHGSYATIALLFFCCAAWLSTAPRWLATLAMSLHAVVFALYWLPPPPSEVTPMPVRNLPMALLMTVSFVAFVATLRAIPAVGEASAEIPA